MSIKSVQSFSFRVKLISSWNLSDCSLPDCPGPWSVPWPHLPHSSSFFPFQPQPREFIGMPKAPLSHSLLGVGLKCPQQLMNSWWNCFGTWNLVGRHKPLGLHFWGLWASSSFQSSSLVHDSLNVRSSCLQLPPLWTLPWLPHCDRLKPRAELNLLSEVISGIHLVTSWWGR